MRRALFVLVGVSLADCGDSAEGEGGTTTATTGPAVTDDTQADDAPNPDDGVGDDSQPSTDSSTGSTGSADDTAGSETTGGPAEPGPVVVYVTDGQSAIHLFSVDESSGALTAVDTYDTDPQVSQLALHPNGLFLYATVRGGGTNRVLTYAIDPASGELTQAGDTALTLDPVYVAVAAADATAGWAMFADFGGDRISVHSIGADFIVVASPVAELDVGDEPHAIVPAPDNAHVYVPHRGSNEIQQFAFDDTSGTLTPLDPPAEAAAPGAGARHLAFDPTGTHAYLSDEFSDSVTHFARDPVSGLLTRLESVSTLPRGVSGDGNTTADCHVTPDGAFVYVSNRGHDSLAMFAADPTTGVVTSIGQVDTATTPREFEVDPTGRFAWAAGQGSGEVAAYSLDGATGQLTPSGTVSVGGSPLWVKALELPAR